MYYKLKYVRKNFPTHLSGGGFCLLKRVLLFRQFWPIDTVIVDSCEWHRCKARCPAQKLELGRFFNFN